MSNTDNAARRFDASDVARIAPRGSKWAGYDSFGDRVTRYYDSPAEVRAAVERMARQYG